MIPATYLKRIGCFNTLVLVLLFPSFIFDRSINEIAVVTFESSLCVYVYMCVCVCDLPS